MFGFQVNNLLYKCLVIKLGFEKKIFKFLFKGSEFQV